MIFHQQSTASMARLTHLLLRLDCRCQQAHQRSFSLNLLVIRSRWRLSHHRTITGWTWVPATCHRPSTGCIIVMSSVERRTHRPLRRKGALPGGIREHNLRNTTRCLTFHSDYSVTHRSIPDWSKLLRPEPFYSPGKIAPSLTEGTDHDGELRRAGRC